MKATGEVMSIANTFESSLMKAIRSLELGILGLDGALGSMKPFSDEAASDRASAIVPMT